MVVTKVQKWGNSQGLRLSRQLLELADIAVGDELEITVGDHQITARKISGPKVRLAELVARIPPGYRPEETDFGPPVGREAW